MIRGPLRWCHEARSVHQPLVGAGLAANRTRIAGGYQRAITRRKKHMPSFQTIFRAVVLVVIGVVGFKAWKLYGPTNEQVKSTTTHVIELVQSAIQSRQQPVSGVTDPRNAAPQLSAEQPSAAVAPPTNAAPLPHSDAPKLLSAENVTSARDNVPAQVPVAPAGSPGRDMSPAVAGSGGDRMSALMTRLQQLGAADTKLAPWGGDGSLYRFTCRAPLPSAPSMTQHFESVAAEPTVAVEQVLAKLEAWNVAQRDRAMLR
jgi:hypothetical protein